MSKLTYEDKKEIVRLYDEEYYGYVNIASKYNICKTTVKRIIKKYHIHGDIVLQKTKNKKLSNDIKLEIINRLQSGESKTSLMILYDVTDIQINHWLNNYEKLGYDGLNNKPKGRPPTMKKEKKHIDPNDKDAIIKEKDQEILELKAEVEALKKLRALVLQRNEQQTKKKQ